MVHSSNEPYPMGEIIQQSPGFKGMYTETGREGSLSIHAHMVNALHLL